MYIKLIEALQQIKMAQKNSKKQKALSITDLVDMPVSELATLMDNIVLTKEEEQIAGRLLTEIRSRLKFLTDVGVGYLTLNRQSKTLSGGESQRINLATSLGSSLVGSLYVLDEPSIGIHSRDTERLLTVLKQLRDVGNTVVVVEHDPEIIGSADYLIDIGPKAGTGGGEVVFAGDATKASDDDIKASYTLQYMYGKDKIEVPARRRRWHNFIEIKNATANNLKNIDVRFPLGVLTVVTGVSGSGKSSLVRDELYAELHRYFASDRRTVSNRLAGSLHLIDGVEFVNQTPIGKSSRSNPATYIKAYDEIRKLFADSKAAKHLHLTASHFSFNQDGGRCDACKGEGVITVPMQFMADVTLVCEECKGRRFKSDVLDVSYKGKNIYDVLEMTVDEAIAFFGQGNGATEKRIVRRLQPLQDVGIGYVKLGQASSTLSGGENQRVKLASFLVQDDLRPQFFIFDEPSTGLHTHDIKTLMHAIDAIIAKGHTVVIIEHNLDIIRQADHIIDLGKDGGDLGGYLIATGTPEEVAQNADSVTGQFIFAPKHDNA